MRRKAGPIEPAPSGAGNLFRDDIRVSFAAADSRLAGPSPAATMPESGAMPKLIALLKKKQGLSDQEFVAHYENAHVPLIRSTFPSIAGYTRNYVVRDGGGVGWSEQAGAIFDVMTELWFEDDAAYRAFLKDLADPAKSAAVQEDERRFLDKDFLQTFLVQEMDSLPNCRAP